MGSKDQSTSALTIRRFAASEAGAWSNSYLIAGESEGVLFDVFMMRSDALRLICEIEHSGTALKAVFISHAHPDHFMALDVIKDHFPATPILATPNVIADLRADGPWMLSMLQGKLGSEGPQGLVFPDPYHESVLYVDGTELRIVEFGECESKHIAALYVPSIKAFFSADLIYNDAHLYLQERHLESWLARLDELEVFAKNRVTTIYPGHGTVAGLELISRNREYMRQFMLAVKTGNARSAVEHMLAKYPEYHVKQFLMTFSIPAYFPPAEVTPANSTG
jgi:glyoxylase-like metal-dependent hydrolase (beta-lactamase superfamily II)